MREQVKYPIQVRNMSSSSAGPGQSRSREANKPNWRLNVASQISRSPNCRGPTEGSKSNTPCCAAGARYATLAWYAGYMTHIVRKFAWHMRRFTPDARHIRESHANVALDPSVDAPRVAGGISKKLEWGMRANNHRPILYLVFNPLSFPLGFESIGSRISERWTQYQSFMKFTWFWIVLLDILWDPDKSDRNWPPSHSHTSCIITSMPCVVIWYTLDTSIPNWNSQPSNTYTK
jgi:hypothetical protein